MTKVYKSTIKFFAHHKAYTAFLFIVMTAILGYTVFSSPKVTKEVYEVGLGSINQSVKVSGKVESSRDANLSFQTTGAVSYIGVRPGDVVTQGKVLATLSGGDAQASFLQAEANLANVEAVLGQFKQGSRPEEIAIKEQTVENAKNSLAQVYSALPDVIQNVDATTADVIKNKFSSLFIFSSGRYVLSFSSCNQGLQSEIEAKRTSLENVLADFQKKSSVVSALSSTQTIDAAFLGAYEGALLTNELINMLSNLLLASCSVSNSSLDGFRTTLSGVKGNMTGLFSDISNKRSALITSKNAFNQASRDLDLTKAGTDPYKLKAQTALVAQALAQVAQARSGIQKTIIASPFYGTISSVDISLGETVSQGKTVISMLAVDSFEIEAKIPEIDIIKIKVGAKVDVTLDAYGSSIIFPATVTRINPTATTEGSVPVYTAIVTFTGKDSRIKQGMSANIQIITETKSKVITIPARFVIVSSQTKGSVFILGADKKEETRNITLGIRGGDGSIEVIDGLFEGDMILAPSIGDRQAQKQNN